MSEERAVPDAIRPTPSNRGSSQKMIGYVWRRGAQWETIVITQHNDNDYKIQKYVIIKGTWCSWLSRSLSTSRCLGEVSGSIPDVSIFDAMRAGSPVFMQLLSRHIRLSE